MDKQVELIQKHLANIDLTLARQEVHLQEHMKRSEYNEKAIEILRQQQWAVLLAAFTALLSFLLHK